MVAVGSVLQRVRADRRVGARERCSPDHRGRAVPPGAGLRRGVRPQRRLCRRRAPGRDCGRVGLSVPPDPRGALPGHQRGRAHYVEDAVGGAHPPAVWQAPGVGAAGVARCYFCVASVGVGGVGGGRGLGRLGGGGSACGGVRGRAPARRWTLATPVLLLALIPLVGNNLTASRKGETLARDFAFDLLQSVEPYGVLVTAGDNDTFPLWYAQEVEHVRQDVTVVNLSLANTDWYIRQLQRRPLATFDSTQAPAIYHGRAWPKPTGKLLNYTDEQVANLQPVYWLEQKQYVNLGGVGMALDPQQLGRQYLGRADVIVLQAIKDQIGKRPSYYSRTVGPYADQFGLSGYLEGHGFARKLRQQPLAQSDSIKLMSVFGFVNLPRTEALAFGVYHAASAARHRPRGWVDRPSEGILATYGLLYQSLAQALRPTKGEVANRALMLADSVFKNTSYGYIPPADR